MNFHIEADLAWGRVGMGTTWLEADLAWGTTWHGTDLARGRVGLETSWLGTSWFGDDLACFVTNYTILPHTVKLKAVFYVSVIINIVALTTTITNFNGVYCPAYMIMHAEDHLISLLSISAVVARLNLVVCFLIFSVNIAFSPFLYRPFEWTLLAGGKWPTRGAKSATWEANLRSSEKGFTRTALLVTKSTYLM